MYKSIHTTVFGPDNRLIQFQIRTQEMEKIAIYGLTSYWFKYKNNARITSINNSVSRIQDLNSDEPELKLSRETETIKINEPTGENRGYILITLTIIVISIIGIGTVVIKKFVLK